MNTIGRERQYLRQLVATNNGERPRDLFREADILERRRSHLCLVIQRLARRLNLRDPRGLELKNEVELTAIREALSEQIATSKERKELAA